MVNGRPPGERRHRERRQNDGLGLLPPARSPSGQLARQRLNRVTGFLLIVAGGFVIGGVFGSLLRGDLSAELSLVLALLAMGYGVYLIARRERRRGGRRQIRSAVMRMPRKRQR